MLASQITADIWPTVRRKMNLTILHFNHTTTPHKHSILSKNYHTLHSLGPLGYGHSLARTVLSALKELSGISIYLISVCTILSVHTIVFNFSSAWSRLTLTNDHNLQ